MTEIGSTSIISILVSHVQQGPEVTQRSTFVNTSFSNYGVLLRDMDIIDVSLRPDLAEEI